MGFDWKRDEIWTRVAVCKFYLDGVTSGRGFFKVRRKLKYLTVVLVNHRKVGEVAAVAAIQSVHYAADVGKQISALFLLRSKHAESDCDRSVAPLAALHFYRCDFAELEKSVVNFVTRISDGEMAILVRRKAINLKYDAVAVGGRLSYRQ